MGFFRWVFFGWVFQLPTLALTQLLMPRITPIKNIFFDNLSLDLDLDNLKVIIIKDPVITSPRVGGWMISESSVPVRGTADRRSTAIFYINASCTAGSCIVHCIVYTFCQRSNYPFYIVSYYINWDNISLTYSLDPVQVPDPSLWRYYDLLT